MSLETILFVLGAAVLGGGSVWLVLRRRPSGPTDTALTDIERHLHSRLDRMTEQIDRRLQDNVHAMNESKSFVAHRVENTEKTVREVTNSLSRLTEAATALQSTTAEIASFQQLLKSPKVRGSFGEVLLGNLLGEVLPADRYELQYVMPGTGEIADAIIRLQDGLIVAVDAKFPLSQYEQYVALSSAEEKKRARTALKRDIKKHVTDISRKYIVPSARTLEYAFMYIPVEGVYYETMIHDSEEDSLWDFCLKNRVVPISPNSFLAYLQTILVGLRGMKIEEKAREILESLGQMRQDFGKFSGEFSMIGKHLNNAKNRFEDSSRQLDKFANRLDSVEMHEHTPLTTGTSTTTIAREESVTEEVSEV